MVFRDIVKILEKFLTSIEVLEILWIRNICHVSCFGIDDHTPKAQKNNISLPRYDGFGVTIAIRNNDTHDRPVAFGTIPTIQIAQNGSSESVVFIGVDLFFFDNVCVILGRRITKIRNLININRGCKLPARHRVLHRRKNSILDDPFRAATVVKDRHLALDNIAVTAFPFGLTCI